MSTDAVKEEEKKPVEAKKEEKAEKKEKKAEKPAEPPKRINVKSQKADPNAPIDPRTGTRFTPGSARQLAFDIMFKACKENKTTKEIRAILEKTKKDSGAAYNMDIGYVNFICASHPEIFAAFDDGTIKLLGEPKIDKDAAAKFEADKEDKKKKADAARAERKNKAKEDKGEKKVEKAEKKEVKPDEKPKKEEKKEEKAEKKEETK